MKQTMRQEFEKAFDTEHGDDIHNPKFYIALWAAKWMAEKFHDKDGCSNGKTCKACEIWLELDAKELEP